jgi:hypothetical protein
MIRDECEVVLPSEAPPGKYQVFVGMYSWPGLERLPAYASDGTETVDGRLPLAAFELSDSKTPWTSIGLSWVAALILIAVGTIWGQQSDPAYRERV